MILSLLQSLQNIFGIYGDVHTDDDSKNDDDLWDYFEEEGSRARCAVCRQVMARSKMREHMQAFHRKLLAAHQDSDDENENFTEVVYLEEDPIPTPKKLRASPKGRPPSTKTSEEYYKTPIRRKSLVLEKKRKESSSDEDNDEINKFTKYISCLLKTVPSDLCTKLQLDIVNLIMTAKLKQQESNTKLQDNIVNNQNSPLPVIYTVRSDNIFQEQNNLGTESASLNSSQN